MDIEIIYDTVCPWCYIGKRRLDQALALRPNLNVTTHWQKTPNSIDSHRLVKYVARHGGAADAVVEALFVAYFVHGLDIGEEQVLLDIGDRHGLDRGDLRAYLAGDTDLDAVTQDNARAHRLGVNGVPSFVFTGPMVISGAQEPQILARMLDAAASAA